MDTILKLLMKLDNVEFFSKVGHFYLNIHTNFYKDRLKNYKNYVVTNTKWQISDKQNFFEKKFPLHFILTYLTDFRKFLYFFPGHPVYKFLIYLTFSFTLYLFLIKQMPVKYFHIVNCVSFVT